MENPLAKKEGIDLRKVQLPASHVSLYDKVAEILVPFFEHFPRKLTNVP